MTQKDALRAEQNLSVMEKISDYLTRRPRFIEAEDVREMAARRCIWG